MWRAEAAVLRSADLQVWRPRTIVVEATVPLTARPSHQEWEPYVLAAGYRLALFDGLNRFYARDDEPEVYERLSVPANVLDNYIPTRAPAGPGSLSEGEQVGVVVTEPSGNPCAVSFGEPEGWGVDEAAQHHQRQ